MGIMSSQQVQACSGFTLLEAAVVALTVGFSILTLSVGLSRASENSLAYRCLSNARQVIAAWAMQSEDSRSTLLASTSEIPGRTNWFTRANIEGPESVNDVRNSPLWPYLANRSDVLKCPAGRSVTSLTGQPVPRVRDISMSHVFGIGAWLDGDYFPGQRNWRTYAQSTAIMRPSKTYVFLEEHPASINDSEIANPCTGNQPGDQPSQARIIDYPASYHNCAAVLSYADGGAEVHRWLGTRIRPPISSIPAFNLTAGDSWRDTQWWADHTTAHR